MKQGFFIPFNKSPPSISNVHFKNMIVYHLQSSHDIFKYSVHFKSVLIILIIHIRLDERVSFVFFTNLFDARSGFACVQISSGDRLSVHNKCDVLHSLSS